MISTELATPPIAGSPRTLRLAGALGAAALIASCVADAAALFVAKPERAVTAHEILASSLARAPREEPSAPAARRSPANAVVADASERRKPSPDQPLAQPLAPCPVPEVPQFEPSPHAPRELGDFPLVPLA